MGESKSAVSEAGIGRHDADDLLKLCCCIPAGILFGWKLYVHWSLPVGALLLATPLIGILPWSWVAAYVLLLFFTVFVHELGHAYAASVVGAKVHSVSVHMLGGAAMITDIRTPMASIYITLAGPLTHVPQFVAWLVVMLTVLSLKHEPFKVAAVFAYLRHDKTSAAAWCLYVSLSGCFINGLLFLANLFVPAYPLDGGRLLVDVLLLCGMSRKSAIKVLIPSTAIMAVALAGFATQQFRNSNAFEGGVNIVFAAVLAFTAIDLWRHVSSGRVDALPHFGGYSRSNNDSGNGSSCLALWRRPRHTDSCKLEAALLPPQQVVLDDSCKVVGNDMC